jgi:hypothetical protein
LTPNASQHPGDLAVIYEWRAGSMPPPYHYEYTAIVGPGTQGKVVYTPNYPSDAVPIWTEPLTITNKQLDNLYSLLVDKKMLRTNWKELTSPPVGGSQQWATVYANGNTYPIPTSLDTPDSDTAEELYTFVRENLVPQAIWDKLETQRQQYEDDYQKQHK